MPDRLRGVLGCVCVCVCVRACVRVRVRVTARTGISVGEVADVLSVVQELARSAVKLVTSGELGISGVRNRTFGTWDCCRSLALLRAKHTQAPRRHDQIQ